MCFTLLKADAALYLTKLSFARDPACFRQFVLVPFACHTRSFLVEIYNCLWKLGNFPTHGNFGEFFQI